MNGGIGPSALPSPRRVFRTPSSAIRSRCGKVFGRVSHGRTNSGRLVSNSERPRFFLALPGSTPFTAGSPGIPQPSAHGSDRRHRGLVNAHRDRIELSPINSGATLYKPLPRGLGTFSAIGDFPFEERRKTRSVAKSVVELVVHGAVPDIGDHLIAAHRVHKKNPKELWRKKGTAVDDGPRFTRPRGQARYVPAASSCEADRRCGL